MSIPFLSDIILKKGNKIEFTTEAGASAGSIDIDTSGNLVLSNTAGDILLGDGASDVYVGDGTNNVDILFEQSGSIKADDSASGVTLTLGSSNTTLAFGGSTSFADIVSAFSPTGINTIDIGTSVKPFKDIYAAHHVGGSSINYATSRGWVEDAAGGSYITQIGYYGGNFSRNGDESENAVVWGIDPFGNKALLWKAIGQTSDDDDDGGWNKDITIPANNNIGYLSYYYFKIDFTPDSDTDGQFYHGCGTTAGQTINLLDDSNNTNPYFNNGLLTTSNNGGAFVANKWYLSVGIIQAYNNETTDTDTITGVYDVETGEKVKSGSEFKMGNNTTGQRHRAYLYYQDSTSSGNMYFWNPGFHAIDGSEPKIQDLVKRQVYLNDNVKAAFGNSNDLNIYHNGSHSFIQDTGTGDLRLMSSHVKLMDASENLVLGVQAGGAAITGNLTLTSDISTPGIINLPGNGSTATRETLVNAHGTRAKLMKEGNAVYWQVAQGSNQFEITDAANGNSTKGNVLLRTNGHDDYDNKLILVPSGGTVSINKLPPFTANASADELVVGSGSGNQGITIYSGDSNSGAIYFADDLDEEGAGDSPAGNRDGIIKYEHNNSQFNIRTGGNQNSLTLSNTNATFAGSINNTGDVTITNGNVIFSSQYGVRFNDANTRIYTNTDSPEDLIIEADQDLLITPDGQVRITGDADISGDITIVNHNGSNPTDAGSLYFNEAGTTWASDMFGFRINQEGSNNLLQFQSVYGDTNINTILTLNRDTKEAIFSGHVKLSTNSHVMSARKFTARDGNGVMLTADDASSGLTIADNGNATFSGTVSASNLSGTNTGDQDLSGYVATSGDQTITGVKTFDTIKINDTDSTRGIFRNNTAYDLRLGGGTVYTDGAYISLSGGTRGGGTSSSKGRVEIFSGGSNFSAQADITGDILIGAQWNGGTSNILVLDSSSNSATFAGDITINGNTINTSNSDNYLEFDDDTTTFNPDTNVTTLASVSGIALATNLNDGGGGNFTVSTGSTGTELLRITTSGNATFTGTVTANGTTLTGDQDLSSYATLASPALTGNPTAPTQTAGNNSTRIATTAFVSTAVSNLVDSAPGTLNTLNELAAALGDDANFSTTVTDSIAGKLPLTGGTLTGDLILDDGSGASPTLEFKNENDNRIQFYGDSNGDLILTRVGSGGAEFQFHTHASDYTNAELHVGGGVVTATKIGQWNTAYTTANNALPKAGGTMTGDLVIPNKIIHSGDTNTYMQFEANDVWRVVTGGTERLDINTNRILVGDDMNMQYDGISTGNSGTVVYGGFLNPASEANMVHIPHIINDLAGFNKWSNATITTSGFYGTRSGSSGSYTYSNEITNDNSGWANAFDAHSSTAGSWYSDNGSDGIYQHGTDTPGVVELEWTNEATYSLWAGIVFGSGSFTATYVKIEAYRAGAWQTLCEITDNTDQVILRQVNGNSGTNAATRRLRYTLGGSVNNSYFRIHSLYMVNYAAGNLNLNNTGTDTTRGVNFLERYKNGYLHGHLRPGKDNTYDLGSSSYEWKDGYFDGTVYLDGINLDGNTITGVDDSGEFTNNDAHIMTSAAVEDKILSYGYTTNTGTTTASNTQTFTNKSGSNSQWTNDEGYLTAHPNISAESSSNNSGRTYIQDITLDSNGHVTGIATATETVTNTNTQLSNSQVIDAIVESTGISNSNKTTIRSNIGAGTSSLALGTTSSTALAGNTTTITTAQANAITANTAKTGISSAQAQKLGYITVTQAVDLDDIETKAAFGNTAYGYGDHADAGYLTSLPSHNHDDRYYTETEIDGFGFLTSSSTQSKYLRSDTADTASGNITFSDDVEIRLGSSAEFRMEHNSSGSTIFRNYSHGGTMYFQSENSSGTNQNCIIWGGSGSSVELRYNNANRLLTTTNGVELNGSVTLNNKLELSYASTSGSQFEQPSSSVVTYRVNSDRFRVWMGGGSNETFTVAESGRIGINDSTPDYTLDVSGNVSNISIYASHDVAAYSDARVKTDIETIPNALDKVNKLRGVTFVRTDEGSTDKRMMGVIAQEVKDILPEVVNERESDGHYSVSYGNMVGVLIEAVKELTAEVEELKKCGKCDNCNCKNK